MATIKGIYCHLVVERVTKIIEDTRIMKLNRSPILDFEDDIAVFEDTQEEVFETAKKLIQVEKKVGLIVSEKKLYTR